MQLIFLRGSSKIIFVGRAEIKFVKSFVSFIYLACLSSIRDKNSFVVELEISLVILARFYHFKDLENVVKF